MIKAETLVERLRTPILKQALELTHCDIWHVDERICLSCKNAPRISTENILDLLSSWL